VAKRKWEKKKETKMWTEEERAIIRAALDKSEKTGKPRDTRALMNLLPGRDDQDVRNAWHIERRKRERTCNCGAKLDPTDKTSCAACRKKKRDARKELIRKGICTRCKKSPLGEDGSATMCRPCLTKSAKAAKGSKKKAAIPKQKMNPVELNLIGWLSSKALPKLFWQVRKEQCVDLFGGSGGISAFACLAGYDVVYNDIHPLLSAYVRALTEGEADKLMQCILALIGKPGERVSASYRAALLGKLEMSDPQAGALLYMMSKFTLGSDMRRAILPAVLPKPPGHAKLRSKLRKVGAALSRHVQEVLTLDFAEVIDAYDSPDTLFLADPPWPGKGGAFEFRIDNRHQELMDRLNQCQGSYLLATSCNRTSLTYARRAPYSYWAHIGPAKELIASSEKLRAEQLTPVDWS
jgi:hypothetical protein